MEKLIKKLEAFASEHDIDFVQDGTVGFWRECVGFTKKDKYIDFNPLDENFERIEELYDERLYPEVADAYHKHNCMAVLEVESKDKALRQLGLWVDHYNKLGVEIVERELHHDNDLAVILHGKISYTWKVKED